MFNIGALMGWTDVYPNDVPWKMLASVYLACGFWTLTFETVYQHQVSTPVDTRIASAMLSLAARSTSL